MGCYGHILRKTKDFQLKRMERYKSNIFVKNIWDKVFRNGPSEI